MKFNPYKALIAFVLLISPFALTGQSKLDTSAFDKKQIGGELKGLYLGGGSAILGGTSIGIIANGFSDYPRSGLPVIAGSIGLAPTSLLGVGLGHLFAKNHSTFAKSFQLGIGAAYSSPIFAEFVPDNAHRTGISVQVLSPELGPWRYRLGFNQYFSKTYEFDGIEAYRGYNNLSWWELNLDLQYMIYIYECFKVYPFIGTQYNRVNSGSAKVNTEVLVNYGMGTNIKIIKGWSLFADMQFTVDPDDNPGNMAIAVGVLYSL